MMRAPVSNLPIAFEEVSVEAGGRMILDRVKLTISAGPPTILIGPNGSPMGWTSASGDVRDELLVLEGASATYEFKGVPNRPVEEREIVRLGRGCRSIYRSIS